VTRTLTRTLRRPLGLALGTAVAVSAVLGAGIGTAYATQLGTLSITPTSGDQDTTPTFNTSAACPSGATNVQVTISGSNGSGTFTDNMVGNSSLSAFSGNGSGGKTIPATVTFKDIFQANSVVSPSGTYTLTAICRTASDATSLGDFVGSVKFTATGTFLGTYVAAQPTTTVLSLSNPGTVAYGTSETLTATVSPAVAGSIQFKDNGTNLGTPVTLASGSAAKTVSNLAAGSHTLTADFLPAGGSSDPNQPSSDSKTLTVTQSGATLSLSASPAGTQQQYQNVTFTATLSQAIPGTVQFKVDGSNAGSPRPVSGTTATYSTTSLAVGTRTISAVFTPTDSTNYGPATAPDMTYDITAPNFSTSDYEDISATVVPGSLTISVASHQVDLGTATINSNGDLFVATGALAPVTITDTRAGDAGWSSSGVTGDFAGQSSSSHQVNAYDLGWVPSVVTKAAHQTGLTVGGTVAPAALEPGSTPSDPSVGLGSSRAFASAPSGSGTGTAVIGAALTLNIPTDTLPDTYTGRLTFTLTG
jgi:hypothetical protein